MASDVMSKMPYRILTRDEHFQAPGPKRILALDGGGLRGMLTLGFLRQIEKILRARHGGDPDFRLCHYFDLVAGTSTGAIIAAALAVGMSVEDVIGHYQQLGAEVFEKNWLRDGVVRARYDEKKLISNLQRVFGKDRTLGDKSLQTGLLIMTKRLDTGSPWPLGNNPRGRYFNALPMDNRIPNSDYPLWKVVRASTAAPSYFDPERITITSKKGGKKVVAGTFVDGGVSPFNNPSLQAFMYATLNGYNVHWKTGPNQILLVSVGTGASDPRRTPSKIAAGGAVKALFSLMDDCGSLVETMMQWMSERPTARAIDGEIGDLHGDVLGGAPSLSYRRYNMTFSEEEVESLRPGLSASQIASLGKIDDPGNLDLLLELGEEAAVRQLQLLEEEAFPAVFNLE
jgi:predicted acylesterase/phospholipase RssA